MASFNIEWKSSAARELKKLDRDTLQKVLRVVESLGVEPRPPGVKKLAGAEHTYRIRRGDYRIVYSIHDKMLLVEVIRIGHRSNVYNNLL
jgi:mRNA interferase RelE/StbE